MNNCIANRLSHRCHIFERRCRGWAPRWKHNSVDSNFHRGGVEIWRFLGFAVEQGHREVHRVFGKVWKRGGVLKNFGKKVEFRIENRKFRIYFGFELIYRLILAFLAVFRSHISNPSPKYDVYKTVTSLLSENWRNYIKWVHLVIFSRWKYHLKITRWKVDFSRFSRWRCHSTAPHHRGDKPLIFTSYNVYIA